MIEKLVGSEWQQIGDMSELSEGDIYRKSIGDISKGKNGWEKQTYSTPIEEVIRIISTGSMQRRFTIPEEVFITSDAAATVIKSRLLNSSYCELDFQDTIDGVDYICQVLLDGGVITDKDARKSELLSDGEKSERP